ANADYFSNPAELATLFQEIDFSTKDVRIQNNLKKIQHEYNWEKITNDYELLFADAINSK
ncbi:MAG TPA: hypothetical protein VIN10_11650, partial [Bacteroidales bacterium]